MKRKYLVLAVVLWPCTSIVAQVSLTLPEALNLARQNNLQLKAEMQNVEIAKSDVVSAKVRLNPSASISWSQVSSPSYFAPETNAFNMANNQITYQVTAPIQLHGQRTNKIKVASYGLDYAKLNFESFEQSVLVATALKWLDVWLADQKVRLVQQAKLYSDSITAVNGIRLRNQVITATEYARTQVVGDQYSLLLMGARQDLQNQRSDLGLLLGMSDSLSTNDASFIFLDEQYDHYDTIMAYALKNRTDLQAAHQQIETAKMEIALQKSLAVPLPELGFSYSNQNKTPYLGLSLAFPLPVYDRNQGAIAKSMASYNQSEQFAEVAILNAKHEIALAYKDFLIGKQAFEQNVSIRKQSERILQSVKLGYLKGGTSILDYLEAEQTWYDIQNQYNEALYNYRKSYIMLLASSNSLKNLK